MKRNKIIGCVLTPLSGMAAFAFACVSTAQAQNNLAFAGQLNLALADASSSGGGGAGADAPDEKTELAKKLQNPIAASADRIAASVLLSRFIF